MSKSTPDMWELVSGLYLHGPNVDTLQTVLPNWTRSDIIFILRKFKNKANRERAFIKEGRKFKPDYLTKALKYEVRPKQDNLTLGKSCAAGSGDSKVVGVCASKANFSTNPSSVGNKCPALLSWSELVRKVQTIQGSYDSASAGTHRTKRTPIKDHSQLLVKVMLYSACFEDHYHGGRPEDTCYSEIYRYLSQLLSGEEPTQLRPRSAAQLLQLLDSLGTAAPHLHQQLNHLQTADMAALLSNPGQRSTATAAAPAEKPVPLFEDVDPPPRPGWGGRGVTLDEACDELDTRDPYYDEKKRDVCDRLSAAQALTASSISALPGLNPLDLPPNLLTTPLSALPHYYPARTARPDPCQKMAFPMPLSTLEQRS